MTLFKCMPPAILLVAALSLAACGGKASFPIKGTVNNVVYSGLVLSSNGMDLPVPVGATSFSFPNSISYGEVFNVLVKTPPLHQSCNTISPLTGFETATDTAGRTATINVSVNCFINTFTIGGSVSGVTTDGLVLTNGTAGGTVTVPIAATSYAFATTVPYNVSYGVTVLTQPTGSVCTVANPTGVMGDAAITNINVTCVPQ